LNKYTGEITLSQPLTDMLYSTITVDISCSNVLSSDRCLLKFTIIPALNPQPVWKYPSIHNFEQCITIKDVFLKIN
jgi:hypothetical protein